MDVPVDGAVGAVDVAADGAVEVAVVRIRAGKGQSGATLTAVSPRATSESTTVSVVSGFGL